MIELLLLRTAVRTGWLKSWVKNHVIATLRSISRNFKQNSREKRKVLKFLHETQRSIQMDETREARGMWEGEGPFYAVDSVLLLLLFFFHREASSSSIALESRAAEQPGKSLKRHRRRRPPLVAVPTHCTHQTSVREPSIIYERGTYNIEFPTKEPAPAGAETRSGLISGACNGVVSFTYTSRLPECWYSCIRTYTNTRANEPGTFRRFCVTANFD